MFRSRFVVAMLAVPAFLLGGASVATAAPAPQATGWTCDGDICMRYVPRAVLAPPDADGCSVDTCITVRGNAGGYSAIGNADDDWYGHVDLWGPNMNVPGRDGFRPTTSGNGSGVGAACAQGWAALGGGSYESKGLPCVNVR